MTVLSGEAVVAWWFYPAKLGLDDGSADPRLRPSLCGSTPLWAIPLKSVWSLTDRACRGSSRTEGRYFPASLRIPGVHPSYASLVSRNIVLIRTNVIDPLNRVPEHDCLTFFMLHRTKCK